ncbi:PREDICTED: uncharacterized protein At1g76070 [Nelumbo nucifera]|uniref:Uncharacterized protein At1g76070 n=2 Tax=Nelumbo nucifera TaxID=4432 RepID=A0A1U8AUQ5_NELNU|nr:PREDICTED: uncharacterized protein At1g76070 [Nelumbo nucifera]DAD46700.1 TPA_asm: hypothetical protein HUJ06_016637 [Nelumbo nucifera]
MEKPAKKSMSRLLSFLPKATAVIFQNPPFSPGRDKRSENSSKFKSNIGKGFSGPIVSIIPVEARTKSKNGNFDSQEPTSPKVSCIGQIKNKKKMCRSKSKRVAPPPQDSRHVSVLPPRDTKKKPSSTIRSIFHGVRTGKRTVVSVDKKPEVADRAPSLGQMKRFASGRNAFANFDWRENESLDLDPDDEEMEESDGEDEVIVPHSAPIMIGGGRVASEPNKEINLWKRRTISPPAPLQLTKMGK